MYIYRDARYCLLPKLNININYAEGLSPIPHCLCTIPEGCNSSCSVSVQGGNEATHRPGSHWPGSHWPKPTDSTGPGPGPGPTQPGSRIPPGPGPESHPGQKNKVGPENKVGPGNKAGPENRVGPLINIRYWNCYQ